jgi:hypothetical protein
VYGNTVHICKLSIGRPTNTSIARIWLRVSANHSHCFVMVRDPKFYKLIFVNLLNFFEDVKYITKLHNVVLKPLLLSTLLFRLPATSITIYILCFILQLQQFIILYEPSLTRVV